MSKRRNLKKPSYIESDSEDDEDFVLPAAKRSKSSQEKTKNRSNVGDRALQREIERAKQLSLNENKSLKDKNCAALDSNKENSNNTSTKSNSKSDSTAKRQTKAIIISSQSDSDVSQTHSTPNANVQAQSKNNLGPPRTNTSSSNTNVSKCTKPADSDSDDEFRISPPVSSEQSSSESEFKLSQISSETSEERGVSSDEEFRLSSEEEFTPEKRVGKPKVRQIKKSAPTVKANTNANVNTTLKHSVKADPTSSLATKSSTTITKSGCKNTAVAVGIKSAPSRTLKPSSRPKSTVNSPSSGQARTVNIPALLSSSQSSGTSHSPLGVKIGLSKNAKFKSLHANIKRQ